MVSARMAKNLCLSEAKRRKDDEFFTRLEDIRRELPYYAHSFRGKTVFCNCDVYTKSRFFRYFIENFNSLGLKKLLACGFTSEDGACVAIVDRVEDMPDGSFRYILENNFFGSAVCDSVYPAGDFRGDESLMMLSVADIVVTNPPFSLAREYLDILSGSGKGFLVVGDLNWVTYANVFPLFRDGKVRFGYTRPKGFFRHGGKFRAFGNKLWLTNLDGGARPRPLPLSVSCSPSRFPRYDNFDAIDVGRVSDIPKDYDGVMGVPITFLYGYCPEQFELLGTSDRGGDGALEWLKLPHGWYKAPLLDGRRRYKRIFIRKRE